MHQAEFVPTEGETQEAFFDWVRLMEIRDRRYSWIFAIPNGELRDKRTAEKLFRQGVRAGVPDVCVPFPRWPHGALYIEFKSQSGRTKKHQRLAHEDLIRMGNHVEVVRDVDTAMEIVKNWLGEPDETE